MKENTETDMLGSWLVQRLQKPRKREGILSNLANAFSFGGGLRNGGLSEDAMKLLKDIFRFDYMGSAEFEFGEVPKALQKMARGSADLMAFEIKVKTNADKDKWRDKNLSAESIEAAVYVLCDKKWRDEIEKRIKKWAKSETYGETKECIGLNRTIRSKEDKYGFNAYGWLELDNGFMFFIDKEMWEKTCKIFDVKL